MNTQITSTDLQQKITGYLEELAKETDLAWKSDEMQKYLDFVARFHQYSSSNVFLILLSKPDATQVAGYEAWKKLGRFVLKGQHGIPILAPLLHKENPDDDNSPKILTGFKVVYVFDVSQTDGDPLPPVPDWKSPEKNAELNEKLIRFAEKKGISVTFKDLPGETQGISKGGAIEISPNAGTKTLIHEIAHELMHQTVSTPVDCDVREMEAESVAYIVSRHFGFEELNSKYYICLHNMKGDDLLGTCHRIGEISRIIIKDTVIYGNVEHRNIL